MKKTAVQQTTFQGGMLEGIKQDVPFEAGGGALTSVLWLENYNHTLQQDSAIKRWGEVDSGVPLLDLGYFTPNMTYSYVVNGGNTLEIDRSTWLQGVQMYSVVHPEYNDNYTTFLKRYPNTTATYSYDYVPQWIIDEATLQASEAVAVVNYTIARDGESPAWQEVWADGNLDYPGWYTFGTLADVTRYGETLLFTTALREIPCFESDGTANPVNEYLYPVYRYLYWDITKKWDADNQFLRGIDEFSATELSDPTNASKFAKWKVLTPSRAVISDIEVGIVDGVIDGVDSSYTSYGGTTVSGVTNDISVIISEGVQYAYKKTTAAYPTEALQSQYKASWMEEGIVQQDASYTAATDAKIILTPVSSVLSYEVPDLPAFMFKAWGLANSGLLVSTGNNYYGLQNYSYIANKSSKSKNVSINPIDVIYGDNWSVAGLEYWDGGIIRTLLEKYTEAKTPRMFLYGEKFDLILTVNLNGVEVILWRGFHQIKTAPHDIKGLAVLYSSKAPFVFHFEDPVDLSVVDASTGSDTFVYGVGDLYYQGKTIVDTDTYVYYGTTLYFSIEIKKETMQKLIDASASSVSLWCIKPDSNRHILKSLGGGFESPSGNSYNKPQEQGNENVDYTKYALLKKFVIDGYTEAPLAYTEWIGQPLATNSWAKRTDASLNDWYVGVPLKQREGSTGTPMALPEYPTEANIKNYLDGSSTMFDTNYWTPDFVIWDYPTETTLFLNSSGKYWKGLGAKLITVIKGRTFIGGCIGADGIEEQAILRYSDVQGGAISPDIFSEERKIQVGHIPHTALLEFREQLWAFSRYQFYRIGLASITQEETWEFFDVVEQGCFNNKSVVVVPYGVVFCNEAGVWLSEGGEPQNLALPILPTYQNISSGTNYLYTNINELAGVPYIDSKGTNPYLELNYDSFNDEILISSPLFTTVQNDDNDTDYLPNTDFTMIFSFKYRTWRIESSAVPQYEVEIQ